MGKVTQTEEVVLVPKEILGRWARMMDWTLDSLAPKLDAFSLPPEMFVRSERGDSRYAEVAEAHDSFKVGFFALERVRDEIILAVYPEDEWMRRHPVVTDGFPVERREVTHAR